MRNADRTDSISIAGQVIWQPRGARPPTFPEGRVCGKLGCTTVLSIYNHGEHCSKHQGATPNPPVIGRPRLADLEVDRRLVTIADFLPKEGVRRCP